jgi:hypothetical protein
MSLASRIKAHQYQQTATEVSQPETVSMPGDSSSPIQRAIQQTQIGAFFKQIGRLANFLPGEWGAEAHKWRQLIYEPECAKELQQKLIDMRDLFEGLIKLDDDTSQLQSNSHVALSDPSIASGANPIRENDAQGSSAGNLAPDTHA